jgi:hypothetical protein
VRGASIRVDPATGDPAERVQVLVKARGAELGARVETARFTASLVGFWLSLGSELVFVGDGGTTEPNDATRRYGVEGSLFWRPTDWLTLDASAAATRARFHGVAPGATFIPNAVSNVISAGAAVDFGKGLSASLRLRHFGAAPLIEDDSVRSDPTTLVNLGAHTRAAGSSWGWTCSTCSTPRTPTSPISMPRGCKANRRTASKTGTSTRSSHARCAPRSVSRSDGTPPGRGLLIPRPCAARR